jgi:hypothetical protein
LLHNFHFLPKSDFITISSYPRDAIIAMSSKTRGEIEGLIPIVKAAHPNGCAAYCI